MELDSFKAILLRKADGNTNLLKLLTNIEEDILVDSVVDALEKMAKPTHLTGINANAPLTGFGANLDRTDITQLRDALGHHLSHYKAALKGHHAATDEKEKGHLRQVADQHLEHAIPLMHLAARARAHSGGKLDIDYPPLAPWETNYTTLQPAKTGKNRLLRDPKLLRVRPSKTDKRTHDNSTTIPDYHYLEMPPHPGHSSVGKIPHEGGYPWEEIQLGTPADIDAKKAYLHIEDVPDKKEYTPHEFDQHPIRGIADVAADHLTPETMQNFATAHAGWRGSEHHKKWMEGQKAKYTADPEGYKKRGQTKGPHFYEGIPLQDQPAHTKPYATALAAKKAAAAAAAAANPSAPPAPKAASASPTSAKVNPDLLPASIRHLAGGEASPKGVTVRKPAAEQSAVNADLLPASIRHLASPAPSRSAMQASTKPAAVTPKKAEADVHPMESAYQTLQLISPENHEKVINGVAGLREYINTVKGGKV